MTNLPPRSKGSVLLSIQKLWRAITTLFTKKKKLPLPVHLGHLYVIAQTQVQILNEIKSQITAIANLLQSESQTRLEYLRFKSEAVKLTLTEAAKRPKKTEYDDRY